VKLVNAPPKVVGFFPGTPVSSHKGNLHYVYNSTLPSNISESQCARKCDYIYYNTTIRMTLVVLQTPHFTYMHVQGFCGKMNRKVILLFKQ
jgi:hypothetical protein